jgi:Flp pilus assembly protein TadB
MSKMCAKSSGQRSQQAWNIIGTSILELVFLVVDLLFTTVGVKIAWFLVARAISVGHLARMCQKSMYLFGSCLPEVSIPP